MRRTKADDQRDAAMRWRRIWLNHLDAQLKELEVAQVTTTRRDRATPRDPKNRTKQPRRPRPQPGAEARLWYLPRSDDRPLAFYGWALLEYRDTTLDKVRIDTLVLETAARRIVVWWRERRPEGMQVKAELFEERLHASTFDWLGVNFPPDTIEALQRALEPHRPHCEWVE